MDLQDIQKIGKIVFSAIKDVAVEERTHDELQFDDLWDINLAMCSRQLGMTAVQGLSWKYGFRVINIQLEIAEALNMNDITKRQEGPLDKTWLWSLHPSTLRSKPPLYA